MLVQSRRNKKAALRLFRKLMKNAGVRSGVGEGRLGILAAPAAPTASILTTRLVSPCFDRRGQKRRASMLAGAERSLRAPCVRPTSFANSALLTTWLSRSWTVGANALVALRQAETAE